MIRNPPANAGGEGNGNPLPYSCLENPMDGGTWWAAVHGVAKSQTRLSTYPHAYNTKRNVTLPKNFRYVKNVLKNKIDMHIPKQKVWGPVRMSHNNFIF